MATVERLKDLLGIGKSGVVVKRIADEIEGEELAECLHKNLPVEELLVKKSIEDWVANDLIKHLLRMMALRWPDDPKASVAYRINWGKTIGQMKTLRGACSSTEECRTFLDNVVVNWGAVKEKYGLKTEKPEFGLIVVQR